MRERDELDDLGVPGDVDDDEEQPHDVACREGWLGSDVAGRPIPCPRCRPELIERLRRQRERAERGWPTTR